MTTAGLGWHAREIERHARDALARRSPSAAQSVPAKVLPAAPASLPSPPAGQPPSRRAERARRVLLRLGFARFPTLLRRIVILVDAGLLGSLRIIIRRLYRVPIIGYGLRGIAIAARLPAVVDGIEQREKNALQTLWHVLARSEEKRDALAQSLDGLRRTMDEREQRERRAREALSQSLAEAVKALRHSIDDKADAAQTEQALSDFRRRLLDESRRRAAESTAAAPVMASAADAGPDAVGQPLDESLAAFYVAFEDRYRGARADIKQWQRVYLPMVGEAVDRTGGAILDVGCGRGEWLELMRENGYEARGVDFNDTAAEECRRAGLDVATGDLIAYLSNLPPESLGVVTAFQVIEHLPFKILIAFVDEALRVLKPGGLIILETPNPGNLLVGANRFWLDVTHIKPLPSETVAFIVEARGYVDIKILPLHPIEWSETSYEDPLLDRVNKLIHGPQDYAVLARK